MWQFSEVALNLVQTLYGLNRATFQAAQLDRDRMSIGLIYELAATGEVAGVPCLAHLIMKGRPEVQRAARQALAHILSTLSPSEILQSSDDFANWPWHSYEIDEWDTLGPADVVKVAGDPSDFGYFAVLALLSFHRNGYTRHEAVRRLSQCRDGSELPFLLIRQNDWVGPIACDAQAAVVQRINDDYLLHLVRSLQLIFHLATLRRRDHQNVVSRVVDLLIDESHRDLFVRIIEEGDRTVRRKMIQHGLTRAGLNQGRIVALGIDSDDPVVRLECSRHLSAAYSGENLRNVLDKVTRDDFMPVRREGLRVKAEYFPETAVETWQCALIDSSPPIRALARCSLIKLGYPESEITADYRRILVDQPDALPVLQGLAETGDQSDVEFFRSLLSHQFPNRRIVAIRGLSRIKGELWIPDLLPFLRDISPRVVREVRKAIGRYPSAIDGEELLAADLDAPGLYARRNAITLIAELGKWRCLPWLLAIASSANVEDAEFAEEKIREWFTPPKWNKDFTAPSSDDKQNILSALAKAKGRATEETIDLVKLGLKQFQKLSAEQVQ